MPYHRPNKALQRTEAGGRVFFAIHVLLRQPPSLSLDSLGALPLPLSLDGTSVPIRFVVGVSSRSLRGRGLPSGFVIRFGQPLPAAAPVIPPPVGGRSSVPQTPKSRA